jgi:hypothetical protein
MKKILIPFAAALLITSVSFAQDKAKATGHKDGKACCKEQGAKGKACCMQPSKTASLRAAAAKPVKKEEATKPAGK